MNKDFREWLKREIEMYGRHTLDEYNVDTHIVQIDILEKYDELHKPVVIPRYVAEWIDDMKPRVSLKVAFGSINRKKIFDEEDKIVLWMEENNSETFARAWLDGYEVEEEPLCYALVKGHELVGTGNTYWAYDKYNNDVFISNLHSSHDNFLTEMNKSEWNELGINDSNADFVKLEEVEE